MYVVDTNILIYAVDKSCEKHIICFELVEDLMQGFLPWFLTWSIIYEFLRVSTHPKVFKKPLTTSNSLRYINSLFSSNSLQILKQGDNHSKLVQQTLSEINGIKGNKIHDAHTAILMREHGISKIYTRDNDFHTFPFLEVIDPLN
ncbi:MAG: type II toxin-antitoxin system VapC family toxin [Candidatus Dadabacteria bacterium]|nr:type II toxin-antitoxin system VapC family toxin [Candidatus Dadabacteria bacterium]NIV42163.1 PIN domain-containing protein [Candidatus Dadabacteria bacterium]NIX16502.1 PIN domain-containing protein [Candidatus Dadabacteria bacterium]